MASSLDFDNIPALTPAVQRAILEEGQYLLQASMLAVSARTAGRWDEAAKICKQVLGRDIMKSQYFRDSETIASLCEILADCLGVRGEAEEARIHLEKAVRIRDPLEYGGLGLGTRRDAATCRERLAYLSEAEGCMGEARDLRLKGETTGEMICSNWTCSVSAFRRRDELKACSGCYAVFYDSIECQKTDWTERHKKLCKAYQAKKKGKGKASKKA